MIAALAEAALALDEPAWLAAAEQAFAFMCREMQRDGRLHHAWRHGRLKHPATLDDHADMAAAALALHEATGKADTLAQAERSEEHTSELQSLMRISYAVFCL